MNDRVADRPKPDRDGATIGTAVGPPGATERAKRPCTRAQGLLGWLREGLRPSQPEEAQIWPEMLVSKLAIAVPSDVRAAMQAMAIRASNRAYSARPAPR